MKNLFKGSYTILLCTALCILLKVKAMSQTPLVGGNVAFSSPQAASITKFGGHSINYSTGTPNINIPVVTVNEGSLSLPVSLQYTYSGLRPTDQASWVGLGFSLMSGGAVSRTIRGLPDELSGNGYLTQPTKISNFVNQTAFTIANFKNNDIANLDDTSPDIYSFQFNGYSGKLVIDNFGNGTVVSSAPIVVKYEKANNAFAGNNPVINKWIFTTEDGTRYTFLDKEYTETNMGFSPVGPNAEYMPSAWYLSEVVDKYRNKITFEYTLPAKTTEGSRLQFGRVEQYEEINEGFSQSSQLPENKTTEIYLTKISGSGWQLQFNSDSYNRLSDRSDIYLYARKLNSIELYSTVEQSTSLVKRFNFQYSEAIDKRLHLLKFEEEGSNPYNMDYDSFVGSALVGRDANVDYWGYYNAINNASLLPKAGADLEPREYTTKMGALTKLTYPTKGYTTIEYEQNTYSFLQNDIHNSTATTVITRSYRRFWNHQFSHPDSSGMFNLVLTKPTRVDVILKNNSINPILPPCNNQGILWSRTLETGSYTMNDIIRIYDFLPCDRQDIGSTPGLDFTLEFKTFETTTSNFHNYGGIRVKKMTDFVASSEQSYVSTFSYTMPDDAQLSSGVISAVPNYEISFGNPIANFNIYRSAPFNPEALSQLYYKAVTVTRNDNVTTYQYTSHSDQADNLGKWAFWFDIGPSTTLGGITESYVTSSFLGMGSFSDYSLFRSLPSRIDVKDLNGNPKQSTVYTYSGYGAPTYSIPSLHYELFADYDVNQNPGDLDPKRRFVYYGKAYYQIGGWPRKVNETVTTYGSNNADPVSVSSTYEYGTNHLQISKQIVSQSDGSTRETSYTYPQDYATATGNATLQAMIAANMVSYPIEQATRLVRGSTSKVIDASVMTYGSFTVEANKPPLYLPNKKFRFNGFNNSVDSFAPFTGVSNDAATASYYETTKYVAYDKRGNLLSVLENGSDKISYLWGYKGQYPVAEIRNADNVQVLSELGGTSFDAMSDETNSATILSKINGLRAGLTSSLVTGYLYQPLVGMTQKIAPNGLSTYYTYDALERLEKVKDNNNQTVKSYKYNYATP